MGSRFPIQRECDMDKPEEHFLWALSQIPMGDKATQPIQPNIAKTISKHLHELAFVHADHLRLLANEDGFIHVDQLPKQTLQLQMPHRGQQHALNGMARWVPVGTEEPEPVQLPDVNSMTTHEQELIIAELKSIGRIEGPPKDRGKLAQVVKFADIIRSQKVNKASDLIGGEQ